MDRTQEILLKVQMIHKVIEDHPYLSGLMTDDLHYKLNDIIRNSWLLDEIDKSEFTKEPNQELLEQI